MDTRRTIHLDVPSEASTPLSYHDNKETSK